jgi:hypothetical protein
MRTGLDTPIPIFAPPRVGSPLSEMATIAGCTVG